MAAGRHVLWPSDQLRRPSFEFGDGCAENEQATVTPIDLLTR
ncbi:hypothetical protein [Streptomyces coelicoflavus]|nr:hypothetical protein [Streptomyces coelicoflavus]